MEIELELRQIPFQSKQELTTFYKNRPLKKRYVSDLFVYGKIVVELKAVSELVPEHEAQVFNYMRIARMSVGTCSTSATKTPWSGSDSSCQVRSH